MPNGNKTSARGPSVAGDSPVQKRKGGRKPLYPTAEEKKQRNRQCQAAFRKRRAVHIETLEADSRQLQDRLKSMEAGRRKDKDENAMLNYKNSLLERVLVEHGIDFRFEIDQGSFLYSPEHVPHYTTQMPAHVPPYHPSLPWAAPDPPCSLSAQGYRSTRSPWRIDTGLEQQPSPFALDSGSQPIRAASMPLHPHLSGFRDMPSTTDFQGAAEGGGQFMEFGPAEASIMSLPNVDQSFAPGPYRWEKLS